MSRGRSGRRQCRGRDRRWVSPRVNDDGRREAAVLHSVTCGLLLAPQDANPAGAGDMRFTRETDE